MSDEKINNPQPEKTPVVTTQEVHQENKPSETKQVNLAEAAIKNAGDQGISLNPVGSHATNPFVAQDVVPAQPPAQTVVTQPPVAKAVNPPPTAQSGGSKSDAGE